MLYFIMRPSSVQDANPVFTRHGGLTKDVVRSCRRAERCLGRVYSTDGHASRIVADYYVEPVPDKVLSKREYWAARNQAAIFVM